MDLLDFRYPLGRHIQQDVGKRRHFAAALAGQANGGETHIPRFGKSSNHILRIARGTDSQNHPAVRAMRLNLTGEHRFVIVIVGPRRDDGRVGIQANAIQRPAVP